MEAGPGPSRGALAQPSQLTADRPPLDIAIDATSWELRRGYGRHVRCLVNALIEVEPRHRYTLFTDSSAAAQSMPGAATVRVVRASSPTIVAASAAGRRRFIDMARMSVALSSAKADIVLFPTIYSVVPIVTRAKTLVMIHDVSAETYPELVIGRPAQRVFWAAKSLVGRWQADAIVAVSEYSRRGIIRRFGMRPDRVQVVGEASDPIFRVLDHPSPTPRLRELGLDGRARTIVYLGGFSPHKNLPLLLNAFRAITENAAFADVRMALVGETQESFASVFEDVRRLIVELGLTGRVIVTGFLPDVDVVELLNTATVLVLPSLIEGFGLPAIEAAACGCPVIATRESPLPDLLKAGGLYIDPSSPADLETMLARVLADPELRARMREAGVAAARQLSWATSARDLLAIMERVAS